MSHHGGSWKVAYADFVTAMMALFLCLWLTSQDQKIKDAVERAFRNPFSSVTKESVGIIPNKDASSTYKQQGRFTSISAIEIEAMHHLSEDLAKLFKDQDAAMSTVKIDVTSEGLSINVFDRSQRPIFNPGSDGVHRLWRLGFQHPGLGNRPVHPFPHRIGGAHRDHDQYHAGGVAKVGTFHRARQRRAPQNLRRRRQRAPDLQGFGFCRHHAHARHRAESLTSPVADLASR